MAGKAATTTSASKAANNTNFFNFPPLTYFTPHYRGLSDNPIIISSSIPPLLLTPHYRGLPDNLMIIREIQGEIHTYKSLIQYTTKDSVISLEDAYI